MKLATSVSVVAQSARARGHVGETLAQMRTCKTTLVDRLGLESYTHITSVSPRDTGYLIHFMQERKSCKLEDPPDSERKSLL